MTNLVPVPMTSRRGQLALAVASPTGDMAQQMRAMSQVGVLFAIVDKLATGCAGVEWKLYRRARSGRTEDRTEVANHPALVVLNRPNPFMTRQELVEAGQQHQDLTGEMWWILARNERLSMPLEIWPVRPDRMKPIPHPTEFISGYEYTGPDGEKIPLRKDEVIFIRRPNPLDPYRGMGPVQAILAYIDGEHYSALWNRNFFLNGAIPGGIIEVDKRLSDPEFDELASRWKEQHQGVGNAHRVAILEQAKWVDVKLTQKDMDFTSLSSMTDEKIRQAFGFPKPMLGTVEDVNRANAEAAAFVFAQWCLVPRLERIKQALNEEFLPLFPASEGLEFDYESPVPENSEAENAARDSRVAAVTALITAGFDVPAVLEWAGLPDLPYTKPEPPPPPVVSPPPDTAGEDGGGSGSDQPAPDEDDDEGDAKGKEAPEDRIARRIIARLDALLPF